MSLSIKIACMHIINIIACYMTILIQLVSNLEWTNEKKTKKQ